MSCRSHRQRRRVVSEAFGFVFSARRSFGEVWSNFSNNRPSQFVAAYTAPRFCGLSSSGAVWAFPRISETFHWWLCASGTTEPSRARSVSCEDANLLCKLPASDRFGLTSIWHTGVSSVNAGPFPTRKHWLLRLRHDLGQRVREDCRKKPVRWSEPLIETFWSPPPPGRGHHFLTGQKRPENQPASASHLPA